VLLALKVLKELLATLEHKALREAIVSSVQLELKELQVLKDIVVM
jgi:hypothetical protein